MAEAASEPRTDSLDVIVELISGMDERPRPDGQGFYDRLCVALCRQASMRARRAMLYDERRRLVVPVGSHGLDAELLAGVYGSLEETPIAQVALAEDRVVQVSDGLEEWVPPRYADFAELTTLTCTPVAAGGRALGVIFADRGGEQFELTAEERHTMWTLGKTAALAASVRIATNTAGSGAAAPGPHRPGAGDPRARGAAAVRHLAGARLRARPQRGGAPPLRGRDAGRARGPARRAVAAAGPGVLDTGATLRERARAPAATRGPAARGALARGRRGAARARADRPVRAGRGAAQRAQARTPHVGAAWASRRARTRSRSRSATTARRASTRGTGMGLRLAAVEALQRGGFVEFGPDGDDWRVRLVMPLRGDGEDVSPERNLRVLVVDDHDVVHWGFRLLLAEQPWVERCLAATGRGGGAGARAPLRAARRAGGPVPGRGVRGRGVRGDPPRVAGHARAAHLRRRLDLAPGGAGGGRVGLHLQGPVRPGRGRGRARGRRAHRVRAAARAALGAALGARAGGARR